MFKRLFLTQDRRLALFWRLTSYLLFFLLVLLATTIFKVIMETLGTPVWLSSLVFTLTQVVGIFGLTYLYRRFLDRRQWSGIALPPPRRHWRDLVVGFMLAVSMMALAFGVEFAARWVRIVGFEVTDGGLLSSLESLLQGLIVFIAVGMNEELGFRGYIFQNLSERFPIWLATLATGLVFGALHFLNHGFGISFVLSAVMITMFLVLTRLLTRALWLAIGWHIGWNWAQSDLFGLSEVGEAGFGKALLHIEQHGPPFMVGTAPSIEGGLLFMMVEALGILLMFVWARRTNRLVAWRSRLAEDGGPLLDNNSIHPITFPKPNSF